MEYNERIIEFIESIKDCYLKKNVKLLKTFFHNEITFFSVLSDNLYYGIDNVMLKIQNHINNISSKINITECYTKQLCDDKYIINLITELIHENKSIIIRITGVIMNENGKLKIYHLHVSTPYYQKKLNFDEEPAKKLEKLLFKQNKEMQNLIDSIPGGMFQCYFDENLTLIQMSQGFLDLVGYTREEIKQNFNNQLRLMINPTDYQVAINEVIEQIKISKTKLIEYRIKCKNGKDTWVLDKGTLIEVDGKSVFSCIVVDINESKVAREELKLSLERHQIIMNQTNDIIFEWNIKENWIQYSNNLHKNFGSNYEGKVKIKDFRINQNVHPKDYYKMEKCYKDILNGSEFTEFEIRIKDITGTHRWYRIRTTTIFNDQHKPYRVVGIIINIDDEVKQSKLLLKQAQEDSLTGLKNRNTVQREIQNRLIDENQRGALLLIDIDNFKIINDTKGHLVGDAVLINIATKMQQVFRKSDIIGRVGGDEFLIFVDTNDIKALNQRANQLLEIFTNIKIEEVKISCSIGIALVPQDGVTFNKIYQKADQALYYAKNNGKNKYAFYDSQDMDLVTLKLDDKYINNLNRKIDRGITGINQALIEYTFKLLYNSIDIEDSLDKILETIGKEFNVSRVYIFENTSDDKYCNNTYEWCNEGIIPQKDSLQNISFITDIPGYLDNFNEQGIFYCQDISHLQEEHYKILESQNIKSVLQCAITENGKIKGFLGFDECNSNRLWQQENIDNLIYISEIVSTFLLKKKAQERAIQESQNLKSVLDGQNSYIYIIDKNNYQIQWMNRITQERAPIAELGQPCYKAFLGLDNPCSICPSKHIDKKSGHYDVEIYNNILDIWVKTTASRINWYGQKSILITCYDITEYKQ